MYGMGAIGGLIGYGLAEAGCELSAVARGETLAALRTKGLRLRTGDGIAAAAVRAVENPAELGVQDLVVIAVKAPALAAVAERLRPLLGEDTIVLPAMNGVPWWFFQGFGGKFEGTVLRSVDPESRIARAIPADRVMGCVVHLGASSPEPGLVLAGPGRRLILGEPSGIGTKRLRDLAELLRKAGFEAEITGSIQREIWYKLWGNMTMNPISALTGATMDRILDDPLLSRFCLGVMGEAKRIGESIGCPIDQSGEERLGIARKLGAFKTSMLQDVESGKPVELDALVASVKEIGELAGESTPGIDALLGLARLMARTRGLYPEG